MPPGGAAAEAPGGGDRPPLSQRMRERTAEVHSAADAAINLRLAGALTDRERWGRALATFYVVLDHLERLAFEHRAASSGLAAYPLDEMRRAPGFVKDLAFYLGPAWRDRLPDTPGLTAYLAHLDALAAEDPLLLLPFLYHLHLGILSGGQLLARTARRAMRLPAKEGTEFCALPKGALAAGPLKRRIKGAVDALELDEASREKFLAQSVEVFRLNNRIVAELPAWRVRDVWEILPSKYQSFAKGLAVVAAALAISAALRRYHPGPATA